MGSRQRQRQFWAIKSISPLMNIAFFSTLPFEQTCFQRLRDHHHITFISQTLNTDTVQLASGHQAVCAFVNDDLSRPVLQALTDMGVLVVGMRCVGLDNVDQPAMNELGMTLLHVPGYSPYSVAEHSVALLLSLVRHLPEAHQRIRAGNFSIDGLMGNDLHGKTVGVVGTGRIGRAFARIMLGFGCTLLAYDVRPNPKILNAGVEYVPFDQLLRQSDVIALHCPLTPQTHHLINDRTLALLKSNALIINTGRGRLVDTRAVLDALDEGQLTGYGADVYEGERDYFHRNFSDKTVSDDLLNRLRSHPKVLLTAHQGFLTEEALRQVVRSLLNQFSFYASQQTSSVSKASLY